MKVTKNKKYIIIGGVIIAVAIGGGVYYVSKHLNKSAAYSEVKNMNASELTTTLNDALKVINAAQQTGDWNLDMVKNLNNRLIQVQARLNMKEDMGDLNTLIDTFKQCDSTVYSLSFDDMKDYEAYNAQLESINTEADKTRDLLKIEDNAEYFRERSINALKLQCDAISKLDGSKLRSDDALSLGKNIERLADIEGESFSGSTCETLAQVKAVMSEAYAKASDQKVKDAFNMADEMIMTYCKDTGNTALTTPITEGVVSVSAGASASNKGVISSDKNEYNLKYMEARKYTVPKEFKIANGMNVFYGKHYYGCKSQEEYDAVVKIMQERVLNNPKVEDNPYEKGLMRYANGERISDFGSVSQFELASDIALATSYSELDTFEDSWGNLLDVIEPNFRDKFVSDYCLYFSRLQEIKQEANSPDGSHNPNSAYDTLVNKVTDCDASSHTEILLFDMMGYNTRIVTNEGRNHTEAEVQVTLIDGSTAWLNIGGLDAYQDDEPIWTPETKSDSTARALDDDL